MAPKKAQETKSYCFNYQVITRQKHECHFFTVKDFPADITPENAFRQFGEGLAEKYAADNPSSITVQSMSPIG
jgi:hypothetical protein